MNAKKLIALLLAVLLLVCLAACGEKNNDKPTDTAGEPKTIDEAVAMYKELMAQENAILGKNTELWDTVFLSANKGTSMIGDGSNYGDFLLSTIEGAKDKFSEADLKLLQEEAGKIRDIEVKLTALVEKFPDVIQKIRDSATDAPVPGEAVDVPAGNGGSSAEKFPAFNGKDLDGNEVSSDKLFSGNAVTVVNFWFTTCNPCVGELSELNALNEKLAEKGGALIGINAFTLGGDATAISEAKDVLTKKGVTYQNVYFDADSEAGKFTANIYAYPTTYVVDRNGNIVGDPIVGAVTSEAQMEALQSLIDKAIAADAG